MESTEFFVSVIIPVYNGEDFLADAISSILRQNYEPMEIIVVDDGSTDGSAAIAKNYKDVRYIYQPNQGVASARNSGLSAAKGEFIAFLDADDTWPARKLQIQVEYLREHPSIMFTISKINNILEPGLNMQPQALQSILKSDQIGLATIVARKAVFDQIGGFNLRYQVGEDLEWFTRAKDEGIPLVILPDILLNRRIHNSNLSIKQPHACNAARLQIIKESIDRQRKKKAGKMEQNNPLVSVVIPVFNGERYLSEAIDSVLNQSYRPIEVVILDDGSTDNTAVIAKRYLPSIKYYYQPNGGIASALNHGIAQSEGEYLSFLDADDLWLPDKLTIQMKSFEAEPTLDMVFGHMKQFFSPDLDKELRAGIMLIDGNMPGYFKGTMLIRRESFFRVGLFDTRLHLGDFVDWYSKAIEKGLKGFMVPDVVMARRIHENNTGIKQRKFQSDYLRILKASLDRRRQQNP